MRELEQTYQSKPKHRLAHSPTAKSCIELSSIAIGISFTLETELDLRI